MNASNMLHSVSRITVLKHHVLKGCKGSRGKAPCSNGFEWSASHHSHFVPRESYPELQNQPGHSNKERINFFLPRHPVVSFKFSK